MRDDQRVAPQELTGLAAPGVSLLKGGGGHVRPRVLQRRHQTAQGAGHDRDASTTRAPPEAVRSAVQGTPGIDSQSDSLRSGNRRDCWKSPEAKIGDFLSKTADSDLDGYRWNGLNRTENHGVASSILALGTTLSLPAAP